MPAVANFGRDPERIPRRRPQCLFHLVALTQDLLPEPDRHSRTALAEELELLATQADSAERCTTIDDFAAFWSGGEPLDRFGGDPEERGQFFLCALELAAPL